MPLEGRGRLVSKMTGSCECQVQSLDPAHRHWERPSSFRMPEHQDRKAQIWAGTTAAAGSHAFFSRLWCTEGGKRKVWGTGGLGGESCQHSTGSGAMTSQTIGSSGPTTSQCWSGICPAIPVALFWESCLRKSLQGVCDKIWERPLAVPPGAAFQVWLGPALL